MPTLASVQASIDAEMVPLLGGLTTQQGTYKAAHGKYFQGLTTASDATLPNNTDAGALLVVPQTLTTAPTDQAETWNQVGIIIPGTLNCSMTVDNYGGPLGQGWVMTTRFQHTGRIFSRSVNFGPETYRDSPWTQQAPPLP